MSLAYCPCGSPIFMKPHNIRQDRAGKRGGHAGGAGGAGACEVIRA